MPEQQTLNDEQLRALASRGRSDLIEKLNDDELRRMVRLVRQERRGPGAGTAATSEKRLESLRQPEEFPKTTGGEALRFARKVPEVAGEFVIGAGEAISEFLQPDPFKKSIKRDPVTTMRSLSPAEKAEAEWSKFDPATRFMSLSGIGPAAPSYRRMREIDRDKSIEQFVNLGRVVQKTADGAARGAAFALKSVIPGNRENVVAATLFDELIGEVAQSYKQKAKDIAEDPAAFAREQPGEVIWTALDVAAATGIGRKLFTSAARKIGKRGLEKAAAGAVEEVSETMIEQVAKDAIKKPETAAVVSKALGRTGDKVQDIAADAELIGNTELADRARALRSKIDSLEDLTAAKTAPIKEPVALPPAQPAQATRASSTAAGRAEKPITIPPTEFKPVTPEQVSSRNFYHGTKQEVSSIVELDPGQYGRPQGLVGPGAYLTDRPDIASGYSKGGVVLSTRIKAGTNLIDLEKPLPEDVRQIFQRVLDDPFMDLEEGRRIAGGKGLDSVRDFQNALREAGDITEGDAIEIWQNVHVELSSRGYDGFLHVGGIQGGPKHNVVVLWEDYGARRRLRDLFSHPVVEQAPGTTAEAGFARTELLTRMAAAPLGAAIAGKIGAREDIDEPFSIPSAVIGGALAFTFITPQTLRGQRYVARMADGTEVVTTSAKRSRQLAAKGAQVRLEAPSFEDEIKRVIDLLPDKVIPIKAFGGVAEAATTATGAIAGTVIGGQTEDEGFSPVRALFGGVLGGALGRSVGRGVEKATGGFNPRRTMQRLFLESRGMPEDLRLVRERLLNAKDGRIAEIRDTARILGKANPREQEIIESYMKGGISVVSVPEQYRDAAATARFLFDEMGVDLIRVGLAEGKAAETIMDNLGLYLPRVYLKHEDGDDLQKVTRWMRARGESLSKLSDRDYLKGRKDIPKEIRDAWGEIHNTAYLLGKRGVVTAQDIEARKYLNFIASSPDYTLAEDLVGAATKQGDNLIDLAGGEATSIRLFNRGGRDHAQFGNRLFRKIENGRMGPLKGRYVEEAIADDLESLYEIPSSAARLLIDKGTAIFKSAKVTYNPASLMRNIYGQAIMTDMAGVSPYNYRIIKPALESYFTQGERYLEARKAGLFGGEWFGTEVRDMLRQSAGGKKSWLTTQLDFLDTKLNPKLLTKMQDFHQASEQANRMVLYEHARVSLGMGAAEAVRFAKRWGFDYRDASRWIQIVRKSPFGAPFISFSYKALPRVIESALAVGNPRQMFRFWKYPMAAAAFNEFSANHLDLVPEGQDNWLQSMKRIALNGMGMATGLKPSAERDFGFQRFLPDYVGSQQILLPWRDDYGRLQHTDGTYIAPWGDLGEWGKGQLGKALAKGGIALPRQLEPSNPWMQLMVAGLSGGKVPFTGRDVVPPEAQLSAIDGSMAIAKFVMQTFAPPLFPGAGFSAEKLSRAGVPPWSGTRTGPQLEASPDVPSKATALLSELGGLRTRPVDPRTTLRFERDTAKRELSSLKARKKFLRRRGAGKGPLDKIDAAIRAKLEQIKDLGQEMKNAPPTPEKLKQAKREQRRAAVTSQ